MCLYNDGNIFPIIHERPQFSKSFYVYLSFFIFSAIRISVHVSNLWVDYYVIYNLMSEKLIDRRNNALFGKWKCFFINKSNTKWKKNINCLLYNDYY